MHAARACADTWSGVKYRVEGCEGEEEMDLKQRGNGVLVLSDFVCVDGRRCVRF